MSDFVQNPRRAPRTPARCLTSVVSAQGAFEATTEDVGGHGCQLVSPRLVRRGEPVQLVVAHEAVKQPLRVAGRVAWASERAPWRLGIAYDESAHPQSEAWFDELLAGVPGLSTYKRIPERIPLDCTVYLAPPPRFVVDLTPDEVALLRTLGSGTSVAEIKALMRDRWEKALRALFSLLAHQYVTLARGSSVHPDAWRRILSEAESSLAVEAMRPGPVPELSPSPSILATSPAPPRGPAPAWSPSAPAAPTARQSQPWIAAAPAAPKPFTAAQPWRPPAEAEGPGPAAPSLDAAADEPASWLVSAADMMPSSWPAPAPTAPAPAPESAPRGRTRGLDEGAAWANDPPPLTGGAEPQPPPARSAEAQGCYERALAELEAGRVMGATALLRRALALSPRDAEISGALQRVSERRRG